MTPGHHTLPHHLDIRSCHVEHHCVCRWLDSADLHFGRAVQKDIHIAPDNFDDTWADVTFRQLLSWALSPADDTVLDKLRAKGRADAVAWAQLTGLADAAAPDVDDMYRYHYLAEVMSAEPPDMSAELAAAAAAAAASKR